MQRLTEKTEHCGVLFHHDDTTQALTVNERYYMILDRLYDYEELGLSPRDMDLVMRYCAWMNLVYGKLPTELNRAEVGMRLLKSALDDGREPGSYFYSWQSNIACCIMDTMPKVKNIHELANKAAVRFLNLLVE